MGRIRGILVMCMRGFFFWGGMAVHSLLGTAFRRSTAGQNKVTAARSPHFGKLAAS